MDPSDGTMTVEDAFATVSELIPAQCTDAATASPDATTPRVDRHAQVMKKQLARSPKVEGKLQDSSSEPEDESSKTPFRRRADRVHASFHAADTNHTGVLNLQQLRDVLLGLQAAECSSSEEEDVDKVRHSELALCTGAEVACRKCDSSAANLPPLCFPFSFWRATTGTLTPFSVMQNIFR